MPRETPPKQDAHPQADPALPGPKDNRSDDNRSDNNRSDNNRSDNNRSDNNGPEDRDPDAMAWSAGENSSADLAARPGPGRGLRLGIERRLPMRAGCARKDRH